MICEAAKQEPVSKRRRLDGEGESISIREDIENLVGGMRPPPSSARRQSPVDHTVESEFKMLKSLIPEIADQQQIGELEIIDACVNYIESLQDQLRAYDPNILEDSSSSSVEAIDNPEDRPPSETSPAREGSDEQQQQCKKISVRRGSLRETQRLR